MLCCDVIGCSYVVKQDNVLTVYRRKSFYPNQCLYRLYHPALLSTSYVYPSMYMHPSIHPLVVGKMRTPRAHKLYPLPLTSSFLFSVTSEMWQLMTLPPTLWRLCGAVAVMWALALWLMLEIEQGACKRDSSSSWGASQVECDKSPFTIGARGQG